MRVPHLSASRFNKYEPLHHTLREVVRYDIPSRLTEIAFTYKCILRGYGFHIPAMTDWSYPPCSLSKVLLRRASRTLCITRTSPNEADDLEICSGAIDEN
jgi:hypothetical protein